MSETTSSDPAFSRAATGPLLDGGDKGLTKREYFAAMALMGLLAGPDLLLLENETCGTVAVDHADELIRSLNRGKKR